MTSKDFDQLQANLQGTRTTTERLDKSSVEKSASPPQNARQEAKTDDEPIVNGSVYDQCRDLILCSLEKDGKLPDGAVLTHRKSFEGEITWKFRAFKFKIS